MSSVEQELLNAVLENPNDDTPRLVYADYWDEQGNSRRAEFVRSHIAMYRCTKRNDCDSDEYTNAVKSLIQFDSDAFVAWIVADGLRELSEVKLFALSFEEHLFQIRNIERENSFYFDRGFVAKIKIDSYDMLFEKWPIFSQWPIERISLLKEGDVIRFKKKLSKKKKVIWVAQAFTRSGTFRKIWLSRLEMVEGVIHFIEEYRNMIRLR